MVTFKTRKIDEQYGMSIGDRLEVEKSLCSQVEIVYAGFPTKDIYSFIYAEAECGAIRASGNIYFPKENKEISLFGKTFAVLRVNANAILLQYVSKMKLG